MENPSPFLCPPGPLTCLPGQEREFPVGSGTRQAQKEKEEKRTCHLPLQKSLKDGLKIYNSRERRGGDHLDE